MDCEKCATLSDIKTAVAACGSCPNRSERCAENCTTFAGLRARCLACNPEDDAGIPHHRVRVIENAIGGDFKIEPDYLHGRRPDRSVTATPLSRDAEDAALRVILAFADLKLWELAIVHCLLNGIKGDPAADRIGLNGRAAYHARLKRLLSAHPWIAALHLGQRLGIKQTVSRRKG